MTWYIYVFFPPSRICDMSHMACPFSGGPHGITSPLFHYPLLPSSGTPPPSGPKSFSTHLS